MGRAPMTDPVGKVYQDSDWDLKTNGRSLAKNVPLRSEFTYYGDLGNAAKRWAKMLYVHPISNGVDYFIDNSKDCKSSISAKNAGGFPNQKAKSK